MARKNKETGGDVVVLVPISKTWQMVEKHDGTTCVAFGCKGHTKEEIKQLAREASRANNVRAQFIAPNGMRLGIKAVALLKG